MPDTFQTCEFRQQQVLSDKGRVYQMVLSCMYSVLLATFLQHGWQMLNSDISTTPANGDMKFSLRVW
jgi:hypothetical protein